MVLKCCVNFVFDLVREIFILVLNLSIRKLKLFLFLFFFCCVSEEVDYEFILLNLRDWKVEEDSFFILILRWWWGSSF